MLELSKRKAKRQFEINKLPPLFLSQERVLETNEIKFNKSSHANDETSTLSFRTAKSFLSKRSKVKQMLSFCFVVIIPYFNPITIINDTYFNFI